MVMHFFLHLPPYIDAQRVSQRPALQGDGVGSSQTHTFSIHLNVTLDMETLSVRIISNNEHIPQRSKYSRELNLAT